MNVAEMQAGRETDFAIAESVMGWRRDRHPRGTIWHTTRTNGVQGHGGSEIVPLFSTDDAAAWLVLLKLVADCWSITISNEQERWLVKASRKVSEEPGGGSISGHALAPFPLAVCRVAKYVTERVEAFSYF